ncbi:hypothetical protein F441_19568 [Phytophthora nicotianae CJ01A1]|uniref:Uncharacterized protein n=1 Tax=Phytophthora nicotianae CJ01A1 TaxID=1317063 RepID=W2VYV5_PHYNI|nr:hypothetical protein F441_19568 [Phytophthora nicotianae CJ01A1]
MVFKVETDGKQEASATSLLSDQSFTFSVSLESRVREHESSAHKCRFSVGMSTSQNYRFCERGSPRPLAKVSWFTCHEFLSDQALLRLGAGSEQHLNETPRRRGEASHLIDDRKEVVD